MAEPAKNLSGQNRYQTIAEEYRSPSKKIRPEYFVIDADRHIIEPPEAFNKYLDKKYADAAVKEVQDNFGATRLMIEGRLYQKPRGFGSGRPEGTSDHRPRGVSLSYRDACEHVYANRDEDMDRTGIDVALWIPTMGVFLPDVLDWDLQYAYMRGYNEWIANDWAVGKRHLWCAMIPLDPTKAVEEIKRVAELGANAIAMRPNVMQDVRWWGPDWDPVWEAMVDAELPLVFHEGTGTYHASYSTEYKFDHYWLTHTVSHPCEMATGMVGIIGMGVLARHPGLRVLLCEGGATWVPFFLGRLDDHFEDRPGENTFIDRLPSEYFRQQCCICTFEPQEPLLKETMEWLNGRNMACTSDYPHWDSSGVSGVEQYLKYYPDFDEETRNRFFSHNAIDVLGNL